MEDKRKPEDELENAPTLSVPQGADAVPRLPRELARTPEGFAESVASGSRLVGKRYTVERLLGKGGMGAVYLAIDEVLGKEVALKVVDERFSKNLDRLRDEVLLAQEVSHRNVCRTYDLEEVEGHWLVKMEYIDGQTLADKVAAAGRLSVAETRAIARQIADGLAAAHERGVVHRDLKPQNILIEKDTNRVVLMDFGLARLAELAGQTAEGVAGTPEYMAPEQARGREVDGRADLYALGCVLYFMLIGQVVFPAETAMAAALRHAEDPPPDPRAVRPDVPTWLAQLVLHVLQKDPARRPADASQVAAALAGPPQRWRLVARIPISRSTEPQPPPLVGREPELRKVEELLEKSLHGSGKFVLLSGEPGIGKTALARSFLYAAERHHPGLLVGRGACVEQYGTGEAYLPFLAALAGLLAGKARERVVVLLRRHAPTWCLQFPSVFSGSALEQLEREAIGANKDRMLRELGDALEEIAAVFPVVLFLEDLHWADPSSIDLIRYLGQRAKTQRLLLVGTARPEEQERGHRLLKKCKGELQTQSACEEIELQPLGKGHITQYLDDHFSPNAFPPELAEMIHRKTEGHPLFATGVFQLLAERGDVFKQDGTWHLARPVAEMDLAVPESVRSMIGKKLEVLEPEDRRTLQYASIEGEEFLSTVLAALLEVDELALEERLDRLQRSHHLIQTRGEEELPEGGLATRYRFAHALYQNFLYADLLSKRRALLHRRAGETLLRCYGGQTARIAMALATHFERGRDFPRAVEFLTQAGDNAVTIHAQAQALEHYSRALELADKLPEEARLPGRMTLRKKRGDACLSLGRPADAVENYNALLEVSRAAGHAEWECRALACLANVHTYTRKPEEMAACATQALEVAERIGHRALWCEAKGQLAASRLVFGRVAEAHALFEQSIPVARSLGHLPALLQGLTYRGVAHFFQSEYEQAVAAETEASQLAKESGNAFYVALSLTYLGFSLANRGRISEALSSLSEALAMARRNGNQIVLSRAPNGVGWVQREIGNLRLAIEYNKACVETARRAQANEAESNALINLAYDYTLVGEREKAWAALQCVDSLFDREVWNRWRFFDIRQQAAGAEYWLAGRNLDRAEEHARRLLANAQRYGVPKYIAVGHRLLGEIAAVSGDANAAEEEFIHSLQPFDKNPAPLVEWRNHAAFGRLLLDSGRRPAAARDTFSRAAVVVQQIYGSITEPELRSVFLDEPAVRQVIAEGGSPALHL